MDTINYLNKFREITGLLDKQRLNQCQLELKVGVWLNSAAIKIQKRSWVNAAQEELSFEESIFFSIWINDQAIKEGKLYYNIHALKLGKLRDYRIKSREFADAFRSRFENFQKVWPNVSVSFGPLTLMEGWVQVEGDNLENIIPQLIYQFLALQFIIDALLTERKK